MNDRINPSDISRRLTELVLAVTDPGTSYSVYRKVGGSWCVLYTRDGHIYSGEISGHIATSIVIDPRATIGYIQGRLKRSPVMEGEAATAGRSGSIRSNVLRTLVNDAKLQLARIEAYLDEWENEDE